MALATKIKEVFDHEKMELVDYYRAPLPKQYTDLSKTDKVKLMDQFISGSKDLIVTLPFSSSDRMINRRIYPAAGQAKGVKTWIDPFPRPVLLHHDDREDAIGRAVKVWYEPRDYSKDFKSLDQYKAFKKLIDTNDPQKIFQALWDSGKLLNPKWAGTGSLMGDVKISDKDAIEKFIDGRYLTFSSGHVSDRWVCSNCGQDWMKGGMCDHWPGRMVDGVPVVHILGTFIGREISVVNKPANDLSFVLGMKFADSADVPNLLNDNLNSLEGEVIDLDQEITMGEEDELEVQTEPPTDGDDNAVVNTDGQDGSLSQTNDLTSIDAKIEEMFSKISDKLDSLFKDIVLPNVEKQPSSEEGTTPAAVHTDNVEEEFVDDDTIDWELLDMALSSLLEDEDAKLSTEKRNELPKTSFCGPNRSFPVPDCAHVTAAKRLVGRAKLSEDQKSRILACVERKAKNLGCSGEKKDEETLESLLEKLNDMTRNYASALENIQILQNRLDKLEEVSQNKEEKKDETSNDPKLAEVKDPQVAGSIAGDDSDTKQLTKFQLGVVSKYKNLCKTEGEEYAKEYIVQLKSREFLSKDFDPTLY